MSHKRASFAPIRYAILTVVAALPVSTTLSHAQEHKLTPEKLAFIETAVSKFMASTHVPGLAIAVVEDGEYEWGSGFGFADLENNAPATEHTLFRLGSISKPLTSVGALQIWERGQLDLDAPVQKYCPVFPQKQWPITTRQVLAHLGGVRHYKSETQDDLEVGNTRHFDDPIQAGIDFFKDDALLTQPGTHYHYSTQGYTLVGCVMEGASRTKYVDFMRQNVFGPAGMEHTRVDDRFAIIPYRTRFYQKTKTGVVENADFLDSSYKIPGGGWLSSAEDIARFEVAILSDKLIRPPTRELMWTRLKPSDSSEADPTYGLGWAIHDRDVSAFGHTGGQQGTSTAFLISPLGKAGVVVLANMEGIESGDLAVEILKMLVGTPGTSGH